MFGGGPRSVPSASFIRRPVQAHGPEITALAAGAPGHGYLGRVFRRRKLFPYTVRHLGERVAWVNAQLRLLPSAPTRSSVILFDDRLPDARDVRTLREHLRQLERGIDRSSTDHCEELRYVCLHLRHCTGLDPCAEFRQGYLAGVPLRSPVAGPVPRSH